MAYQIIHVMDHYEVYIQGEFVCSGDRRKETEDEAEEILCGKGNEANENC